jgi:DNA polymerase-3 subunit alpha
MKEYLMAVTDTKKRVTMQNFNALVERDLLPESLSFQKRLFAFNKALKAYKRGDGFVLSDPAFYGFYERNFDIDLLEQTADGPYLPQKAWKKAYDKAMQPAKDYIVANNARMLDSLNRSILRDEWVKYALGNASSWEMDSMGYYYHTHELAYVDKRVYGIDEFKDMQDCSATQRTVRGRPVYELTRIAGTVIAKDDLKCLVTLVTPESGVVDVKFYKSTYADYNRQLSEVLPDGTKRVIEKPWFTRGTKLIVTGFKRSDTFVAKVYKNSGPMVFKVLRTFTDGTVEMVGARANEVEND